MKPAPIEAMKDLLPALAILSLLAGCDTPDRRRSSETTTTHLYSATHTLSGSSRMTAQTGTEVNREMSIEDRIMTIRFQDSGVQLDLADFPGETITRYFKDLKLPLHFQLPDGTLFVYRGDSIEVGANTYQITQGKGIAIYEHPGVIRYQ